MSGHRGSLLRWVFVAAGALASAALGQGAGGGLVNSVSGTVTYTAREGGVPRDLTAFSRLAEGDRVDLAPSAQVRITFLESGRQERWTGPASFRIGRAGGEPIAGAPVEIATLPAGVPQRIARVPDLVRTAKLGGIQVRGGAAPRERIAPEPQTSVGEVRAIYEKMRKNAAADDITPELYLYAALEEHRLYEHMQAAAEEMLRRQPGDEAATALLEWARERSRQSKRPPAR